MVKEDKTMTLSGWINFYEGRLTTLKGLPNSYEKRRNGILAIIAAQERQLKELDDQWENREVLTEDYETKLHAALARKAENDEAGVKGMTLAQLRAKRAKRLKLLRQIHEQFGEDAPEKYKAEIAEMLADDESSS